MKPPLIVGASNDFQTPPQALMPLLPYIDSDWVVWECACGEGYLSSELLRRGFSVISSDIMCSQEQDFLSWEPSCWDCVITNPPFSLKQKFLERAYQLRKPFALLLPLTTLETAKRQHLFQEYGVEIVLFDKRINFITPSKKQDSSSWFATAWFTHGLGIGKELSFVHLAEKELE